LSIERRKILILLSVVVAAVVISGIVLNAYSTANAQTTVNGEQFWSYDARCLIGNMSTEMQGWSRGGMRGRGFFGFVEVSDEFKENVVNIAENDADVQNLINEGYNITSVKPLIKSIVERDGTVVTKATSAILILEKDTTGRALVWVDLEQEKATRIEILTITVIEK